MNFERVKRSNIKKKIIIGILTMCLFVTLIFNYSKEKYKTTQSIPFVNETINYSPGNFDSIAIYIQSDGGYTKSNTIPESGYALNEDESYCKVNNVKDNSVSLLYDIDTKTLSVTPMTKKGTKCYLYFDELKVASDIIADLVNTSDEVVLDDAGNPRYIGADPNNYVYFNCDDYTNPSSSTCELWRIIGVFSEDTHGISNTKLIKLIRSEFIGDYAWDSGNVNDWTTASLQETLNENYLSGANLENGKGITSSTNNMIEKVMWKLGGAITFNASSELLYNYERGTNVYSGHATTWNGKIGLMYVSDYGYATSGGNTMDRTACLATYISNWGSSSYSDCKNNDWLYNNRHYQWTFTLNSSSGNGVFGVLSVGAVLNYGANYSYAVRPSIYLKSNIAISGGDGSNSNPYTLIM